MLSFKSIIGSASEVPCKRSFHAFLCFLILAVSFSSGFYIESLRAQEPDASIIEAANIKENRELKNSPEQRAFLLDGLQEIVVAAKGQGELSISVSGNTVSAKREFIIQQEGLYGLTFPGKKEIAQVRMKTSGEVDIQSVTLQVASAEQEELYKKYLHEVEQFGFHNTSYQRPAPGNPERAPLEADPNLPEIKQIVFLKDPMAAETRHVKNSERLHAWLSKNGAVSLDMLALNQWFKERLEKKDAYGTAVLFSYGATPLEIMMEGGSNPLWFQYLKEGGRIVNIGDLPFYTLMSITLQARKESVSPDNMAFELLDLPGGWNTDLWGRQNLTLSITEYGKVWGFEKPGVSINGSPAEKVTMPGYIYKTPEGKVGTSVFFKNFNPFKPWSGFVQLTQSYDGNDDAALRDVWRGLHFVGYPINTPKISETKGDIKKKDSIRLNASGLKGRKAIAPDEIITFEASDTKKFYISGPGISDPIAIQNTWDTTGYAPGKYEVANNPEMQEAVPFQLNHVRFQSFPYQIWATFENNNLRNRAIIEDIRKAGMAIHLREPNLELADLILEAGLPFSVYLYSDHRLQNKTVTPEKNPEFFRLNIDGKHFPYALGGGLPTPGIFHPETQKRIAQSLREEFRPVKRHPAFIGVALSNDDFSTKYGWDFSEYPVRAFKEKTGYDAPSKKPENIPPGVIPDNDPWLQWILFSYRDITGAFTKMQQSVVDGEQAGTRLMLIPGGMQIPLVSAWTASQYPPLNFGKYGPGLVGFYYYNSYWQPQATAAYWTEVGKMGNRDLEVWTMPDCYIGGASYFRNNLYHALAGGIRGLVYYTYSVRAEPQWKEMKKAGSLLERIGPAQSRLRSSDRKIALLLSVTTLAYDTQHAIDLAYAYHNLSAAGYSVDVVAEEEIRDGILKNYKALVLSRTNWLAESTVEKLEAWAKSGGLILADESVKLRLPFFTPIGIDLNEQKQTYGDVEKITKLKAILDRYVPRNIVTEQTNVFASTFKIDDTPYVWLVNAHTGDEYRFCYTKTLAAEGGGTEEKIRELWKWDEKILPTTFKTSVRFPENQRPVIYDLVREKQLSIKENSVDMEMDRFGGSLLAFLDAAVGNIVVEVPERVVGKQDVIIKIQLQGGDGKQLDASIPVQMELTSPDGTPHWNNRWIATENGVAEYHWQPAINDPEGQWQVKVSFPSAGVSAHKTIYLDSKEK